jgi:hypothetical protein
MLSTASGLCAVSIRVDAEHFLEDQSGGDVGSYYVDTQAVDF